jgi:hypothetical protein
MYTESIMRAQADHKGTRLRQLILSFAALVLAATVYPAKAHAQIIGNLEVNVPFQFHVGHSKLPAGKYIIHMLDNSDLQVMEITSADGSVSALFDVEAAEASSTPAKTELIFNKYGNRYFLAKLFEEGSADGSQVLKSGYEKRISQQTSEAQEHVPAQRPGQQGN